MTAVNPSGSPVMIRRLPEHLYSDAVALWQQTGLTRPWNDPTADLRRAMTGSASTVLAAIERDVLLATAMVGHDGHRGWVYYLAVTPTEQGRGLGRRLMQACEQWVRDRGVPKLQLMVRADNAPAAAFYERLGYADAQVVVLGRRLDGVVPQPERLLGRGFGLYASWDVRCWTIGDRAYTTHPGLAVQEHVGGGYEAPRQRKAQAESRKGAEQGKQMLKSRLSG